MWVLSGRSSFCPSWWAALLGSSPLPHGPSVGIQSLVCIMTATSKASLDVTNVLEWEMACFYASVYGFVQVQACGSVVTEEQPHAMLVPMEYFLMGYGLYRPSQFSGSPRSPLSPSCISPELLSPESMGLKLKPIKTRIPTHVKSVSR